jgi:hypothetical protein
MTCLHLSVTNAMKHRVVAALSATGEWEAQEETGRHDVSSLEQAVTTNAALVEYAASTRPGDAVSGHLRFAGRVDKAA